MLSYLSRENFVALKSILKAVLTSSTDVSLKMSSSIPSEKDKK